MNPPLADKAPKRLSLLNSTVTTSNNNNTPPRALQLVDGSFTTTTPLTSPRTATPPLSASASPSRHAFTPRRQSSISYAPRERDWSLRSPPLLARSNSQGTPRTNGASSSPKATPEDANGATKDDRRSTSSADAERPLTLAEKHADLLRFIAQKESKCLELRSQLAAHEAELLTMKRKWERIVRRGGPGGLSPADNASASALAPTVPQQTPTTPTAAQLNAITQAAVLGGIKEGVQGVGRFIAGLGERQADAAPAPVRLAKGHAARPSTSSASTHATSTTRFSQSSFSSAGAPDEGAPYVLDSPTGGRDGKILGDDAASSPPRPRDHTSVGSASGLADPDMRGTKMLRRKSHDYASQNRTPPPADSPLSSPHSPSTLTASTSSSSSPTPSPTSKASSKAPPRAPAPPAPAPSFPPASSIPGLSALSTAAPPLSAWVGTTVGRRWGELQKGQKRASVLLSDVSTQLFAALAAPASPAPATRSLLDDDDSGDAGATTGSALDSVASLAPDPYKTTSQPHAKPPLKADRAHDEEDDEDWNW